MQGESTTQGDFTPKKAEKVQISIPCGNIKPICTSMESRTTARMSYVNPGVLGKTMNMKPAINYCPPTDPIESVTVQKMSYQPAAIGQRVVYPWQIKPKYR